MATGDPFYCYEHKCFVTACGHQKHGWETTDSFKERQGHRAHPECPSCRCPLQPFTEVTGWK